MTTEPNTTEQKQKKQTTIVRGGASEAVYGFGLIGAWIYFIGHATTFWVGVLGFLKGIIWPVLVVYELLKYLKM
jgi:hypothetical protein